MTDIHEETMLLAEAQRMADAATALYGVPRVSVVLVEATSSGGDGEYDPATREVRLNRAVFALTSWRGLLAHECGHVTLSHETLGEEIDVTTAEQAELDATARAVEILVRIVGLPVEEAVNYWVQAFGRIRNRLKREGAEPRPGEPHPDVALRDLLARFGRNAVAKSLAAGDVGTASGHGGMLNA